MDLKKNVNVLRGISNDLSHLACAFANTGNKHMEATLMETADKINAEALAIFDAAKWAKFDTPAYATVEVTFTDHPEVPDNQCHRWCQAHALGHIFDYTIRDNDGELLDHSTDNYSYGEMVTEIIYYLETSNLYNVAVTGEAGGWGNLEQKITEAGIEVVQL